MTISVTAAIIEHQSAFGLNLDDKAIEALVAHYDLVQANNPLLHLVAPCPPEEFAVRHILESLLLTKHLSPQARFIDIGPGGGFPGIPCLLVRKDLRAVFAEPKEKKARFLEAAIHELGLEGRVTLAARQFSEIDPSGSDVVTSRALDRFTERLPELLKWARGRKLVLFAGGSMREALVRVGAAFNERLIPLSEQRFLFVVNKPAPRSGHPNPRSQAPRRTK